MTTLRFTTIVKASPKTLFDLSRNVDFHANAFAHTKEKAVAGKTSGLLGLGEQVTWEAVHFGIKQKLTAKITFIKSPESFIDEMVQGAFSSFWHKHEFLTHQKGTQMLDEIRYTVPYGILGKLFDVLFLQRHLRKLITTRNLALKEFAESQHLDY